jgi:hypothetical protein
VVGRVPFGWPELNAWVRFDPSDDGRKDRYLHTERGHRPDKADPRPSPNKEYDSLYTKPRAVLYLHLQVKYSIRFRLFGVLRIWFDLYHSCCQDDRCLTLTKPVSEHQLSNMLSR